eukprot:1908059-Amphidinium_carterae.2
MSTQPGYVACAALAKKKRSGSGRPRSLLLSAAVDASILDTANSIKTALSPQLSSMFKYICNYHKTFVLLMAVNSHCQYLSIVANHCQ